VTRSKVDGREATESRARGRVTSQNGDPDGLQWSVQRERCCVQCDNGGAGSLDDAIGQNYAEVRP
jgi:hypothetical protein